MKECVVTSFEFGWFSVTDSIVSKLSFVMGELQRVLATNGVLEVCLSNTAIYSEISHIKCPLDNRRRGVLRITCTRRFIRRAARSGVPDDARATPSLFQHRHAPRLSRRAVRRRAGITSCRARRSVPRRVTEALESSQDPRWTRRAFPRVIIRRTNRMNSQF